MAVVSTLALPGLALAVELTPDGTVGIVATRAPDEARFVGVSSSGLLTDLGGTPSLGLSPNNVTISPDGGIAVMTNFGGGGSVSVFDLRAGIPAPAVANLPLGVGSPQTARFTPDGARIFVYHPFTGGRLSILDVDLVGNVTDPGTRLFDVGATDLSLFGVDQLAFSSYGARLCIRFSGGYRVLDVASTTLGPTTPILGGGRGGIATVCDPCPNGNPGDVIGVDAANNATSFATIQHAVDDPNQVRVFVFEGVFHEEVWIRDRTDLEVRTCGAVTVDSFGIKRSRSVTIRGFDLDASLVPIQKPPTAITLLPAPFGSDGVRVVDCRLHNAFVGAELGAGNHDVVFLDCAITGNTIGMRTGEGMGLNGGSASFVRTEFSGNLWKGALIHTDALLRYEDCQFLDNGLWGIYAIDVPGQGAPQRVTMIDNVLAGNHGFVIPGIWTENMGNYHLIIDATDNQPIY
jgi:hypothetical protein